MPSRCWPSLLALIAAASLGAPATGRAVSDPPAEGASGADPQSARAELDALATRIEALKKEIAAGRARPSQLEPLLARAQELAAVLDRSQPHATLSAPAAAPDAQELRERADALRDRADRLDVTLKQLDRRIAEERRRADLQDRLQAVGGGDMLADGVPRRAQTGTRASVSPPTATTGGATGTAGSPTTATNPAASFPPPASGAGGAGAPAASSVAPDPAARAVTAPLQRDPEALRPGDADSLQELLRKRGQVQRDAGGLRAGADALEAEARAAEKVR